MNKNFFRKIVIALTALVMMLAAAIPAMASDDDNSLYSLGITTEGVTVEPEFSYDIWEYTVTVPGGTKELTLEPVASSNLAKIAEVSGTTLSDESTGTVFITVEAGNGAQHTYTLNVVSDGTVPATEVQTEPPTEKQTEKPTEKQTEKPTEKQTESPYVEVDRNTVAEAQNTINDLKKEIARYRDTVQTYTYLIYGMIALCVIMLFIIINQIIRKKDLKDELNDYRSLGYSNSKSAQKARKKQEKAQQKLEKKNGGGAAPAQQQGNGKQAAAQKEAEAARKAQAQREAEAARKAQAQKEAEAARKAQAQREAEAAREAARKEAEAARLTAEKAAAEKAAAEKAAAEKAAAEEAAKRMPQYEDETVRVAKPKNDAGAQGGSQGNGQGNGGAQGAGGKRGGRSSKDVEITMIDL